MSPMRAAPLLREKKEERRVSGERISSRAALVFFFGVADATAGSLDRHQERRTGEEPRAIVFFVCSLAEATQRTFASRLARSDSIVAVRTGLEQPVSESFSEPPPPRTHRLLDAGFSLLFLSTSLPQPQPFSLSPHSFSLSPLLFPPQRKKQSASSSAMGGADEDGAKKPTKAKLGVKNEFYFDEELKCWRERGAPPPEGAGPLAPPPTSVPGMSSSAANDGGGGPPQSSSMLTAGSTAAGCSTSE